MTNWHEQHPGNLYQLCDWLHDECDFTASELLYVIEKPWNWEREWGLCELWHRADGENNELMKERCLEAVTYTTTAEMVAAEFEVTL